jgi:hypothetical protein
MFGTIARLKVKPGEEQGLRAAQDRWWRERRPKVKGAVTSYLCKPVNGARDEQILIAIFDTKENYVANANDPEQDAWYQEFRSHLAADPEWTDVEIEEAPKG